MYKMYDTRGRGDQGAMSWCLRSKDDHYHGRPKVGYVVRVGAARTTMFGADTWWQTTPVDRIISDEPSKIVFETANGSTYTWETSDG